MIDELKGSRDPSIEEVTARQAAEGVLLWAKQNHILAKGPVEDSIEDDTVSELQPQKLFESQSVKAILKKRAINLVAYSEAERKVVIFTHAKLTQAERKILPFQLPEGVKVDYLVGGTAQVKGNPPSPDAPLPYTLKGRAVCCGSSIHPVNCLGAGTFGALVRGQGDTIYGLTNNHVSGACNLAAPGLPILCPGPIDATEDALSPFTIGRHSRLLPISEGIPENINTSDNCDAAIFEIEDAELVSSMQGDRFDTPSSAIMPFGGMRVEKVGRTTGFTSGRVVGYAASPMGVGYSVKEYGVNKNVYFDDVVIVQGTGEQPFSRAGDSGSLVVGYDEGGNRHAVGLVFAGTDRGLSYILPLPTILGKLGVELVYGHNA